MPTVVVLRFARPLPMFATCASTSMVALNTSKLRSRTVRSAIFLPFAFFEALAVAVLPAFADALLPWPVLVPAAKAGVAAVAMPPLRAAAIMSVRSGREEGWNMLEEVGRGGGERVPVLTGWTIGPPGAALQGVWTPRGVDPGMTVDAGRSVRPAATATAPSRDGVAPP